MASTESVEVGSSSLRPPGAGKERRHQIPGLRRTPYLKLLLVRCDDNETYKSKTRAEIRDWIKTHTASSGSTKKTNKAENHDAFEWLVVHVVLPNTAAATQPRVTGGKAGSDSNLDTAAKSSSTSRWRSGPSTLLEKLRSDFNSSGKNPTDRIAQIRIGINDVPYDILPRVVPAVPTGYQETAQDAENAWLDLIGKFRSLILSSFDVRVSQYEEDIKEKDAQRTLPGWNFCTFFILKEGLARGFESVGLVEDALIGYDELSVGLDTVVQVQAVAGSAEAHGGSLLSFTEDLRDLARRSVALASGANANVEDEEAVDLQSTNGSPDIFEAIPIASTKKPYRDLILANNVSVYDFRCYIFARQISLLLRLGNAWSTREELLAKLKEQQESVLHGVAPQAPPPKPTDESENLSMLAEICRRTLEFIPAVSQVMRRDIVAAMMVDEQPNEEASPPGEKLDPILSETIDNIVASFAFSVAQQILAQTSTKALPIPPSTLSLSDAHEPKAAIPEPKTMMHPARSSSLHVRPGAPARGPPSPGVFPGPGRRASGPEVDAVNSQFLKAGLEEFAARRAELYTLCRNIHEECGKRRGWSDGWDSVPIMGETEIVAFHDVNLDDSNDTNSDEGPELGSGSPRATSLAGIDDKLLRTALADQENFYRLYETLIDKALRHYTVANHTHSVKSNLADLAVLKFHLGEYGAAATCFHRSIPFYGESGWNLVELSMLVMYSRCLRELQKQEDYATVLLKLLSKAAAAEMDKIQQQLHQRRPQSSIPITPSSGEAYPVVSAISGLLGELLLVSGSLDKEIKAPLANYFCDIKLGGAPVYDEGQDGFSLTLHLRSLLVDEFEAQKVRLRLVSLTTAGDKEIWLQTDGCVTLRPGSNSLQLRSNAIIPGDYEVHEIILSTSNLTLQFGRNFGPPGDKSLTILRNPRVSVHQRASCLDVRLAAAKDIQLDRNNSLELEVLTGWNDISTCEVRVKCATGGLRLIMNDARVVGPYQPAEPLEGGGTFTFGAVPANSSIKITFPFNVEQDLLNVAVKIEVAYTTERGAFSFCKTSSVPIALALGVNVQDVFKHNALFSRFTVSTATPSPLRLFKSELLESDLFESHFGFPPSNTVTIFPKQPASLLYKITRKRGSPTDPKRQKTMHLKLYYSVFSDEIEDLILESLKRSLEGTALWEYSPVVLSSVASQLQESLSDYDLERAALLGEVRTSFLSEVKWSRYFTGLGGSGDDDVAVALSNFVMGWQKKHQTMSIPAPDPSTSEPKSILIPVDIPSINIVHTADIRIHDNDTPPVVTDPLVGTSAVCINQLLPATLHLKWTRVWDTGDSAAPSGSPPAAMGEDIEFSYEVTAPTDTWLLGGRRKGHFVIPAVTDVEKLEGLASTPDSEADIALLLSPLREGWLPYPNVEIREVRQASAAGTGDTDTAQGGAHCETDYRNLGETVRVIADRAKVTLSLDASGPGGGPLVLESQLLGLSGRVVA